MERDFKEMPVNSPYTEKAILHRMALKLAFIDSAENHTVTDMHFLERRDKSGMEHELQFGYGPSICV
ncbi:hypothetical protein J23TS9_42040 [Paenibacillus sp. J23TS9]|nr:hypothetical protein J23TS9_42040 [Paenibacillus sp. J23TS9]